MSQMTVICNSKGGVGKTLTVVSLVVGIAQMGKRVLLIDAESQGCSPLAQATSTQIRLSYPCHCAETDHHEYVAEPPL